MTQVFLFNQNLPSQTRVIRAMPNTPALVQTGATVIAPGSSILAGDKELIQGLFRTIGICEVGSEEQLDAVTGLSGSGPAYVSHYSLLYTWVQRWRKTWRRNARFLL